VHFVCSAAAVATIFMFTPKGRMDDESMDLWK
jgi:hypothetical protein